MPRRAGGSVGPPQDHGGESGHGDASVIHRERVEARRLPAGHAVDDHAACTDGQQIERGLRHRTARGLQDHIHAARLPHAYVFVPVRRGVVDHCVRAEPLGHGQFLLTPGNADHGGARAPGQLHEKAADTPRRPRPVRCRLLAVRRPWPPRPPSNPDPAVPDLVVIKGVRAGQRCGGGHHGHFGVAATRSRAHHPPADRCGIDAGPDIRHSARHLKAWRERHRQIGEGSLPRRAGPNLDVGEPDARGGDPDQQLPGPRPGIGYFVDP
ncbi:hypothetical protein STENM327S_07800 [Streptomyces tendae]